jgi:hypothetical protein
MSVSCTHCNEFKFAKTVKEAQELVESGFDYVCEVEGHRIFRKRK